MGKQKIFYEVPRRKTKTKFRVRPIVIYIIIVIGIIVASCVVWGIKKYEEVKLFEQAIEKENLMDYHRREAIRAERERIMELEYRHYRDSVDSVKIVEREKVQEENRRTGTSMYVLERMVRDLTNEDYYVSVWVEDPYNEKWVVIYTKGGKDYFRRIDLKNRTYGKKIRLVMFDLGEFYVYGNKRDRYYYDKRNNLIHEVNGVQKEVFEGWHTIDVSTSSRGDYDDIEDYEDIEEYYDENY